MRWLIVALVILFIAMLALFSNLDASYGAVVLIGPIPIVVASDVAMALILLLLAAIIVSLFLIFSFLFRDQKMFKIPEQKIESEFKPKSEKKFGGVVLIGPLPIIFGDTRIAILASIVALLLMILALLMMLR
ncbi:MAG: DUF131 domain-containing protein [Archaeoglobaceae archaeon]|nr:DUF131 domain-containing protein [Archaeoglobaceae archaeon]